MTDDASNQTSVTHADAYTSDLDNERNGSYSVDITVRCAGENTEGTDIAQRGTDIAVEHPVEDVQELRHRRHITAQLAVRDESSRQAASPAAFDNAVLDVADRALNTVGIDVTAAPIEQSYLYALLLHEAWGFNSLLALIRHLNDHQNVAGRIGMSDLPSDSTFYTRAATLTDEGLMNDLTNAGEAAVHAVWRNCGALPGTVMEYWELDTTTDFTGYPISADTRRAAIRNWVELLLTEAAEILTFDRAANASYTMEQFIGVFAHSALQNIGLTAVPNTAAWLYDAEQLATGESLLKHIKADSLTLDDIDSQFAEANAAVLQRGGQLGLFDDPLDLAFDTVDITWWGDPLNETVGKRRSETDATPDWVYGVLIAINKDARVCFGVDLVKSKDLHDNVLDNLLATATTHGQIQHVFADKEFYEGSVIETLRKHIGDGWVIKAQQRHQIEELIRNTPKDDRGFRREIPVTSATPAPNAFAIPKRLHGQQTLVHFTESNEETAESSANTHTAYLTDMDDTTASAELIKFRYNDRWSIETAMRQYQHDFHPTCRSGNVKIRVYCAKLAMLFFNWHALINRALSPQYNLPLTVTHHELLTAIRDVAFTSVDN